jgi:hypothetical protein
MYYHSCGYFSMSFGFMTRALGLLSLVAGDQHPEIASIYLNLGLMYQEVDQPLDTAEAYQNNLQQNIGMYGETNIQTASSFQTLGQINFQSQKFRKALNNQESAYKIFQKLFPENSPYIQQAKQQLDYYFRLSVSMEKHKQLQAKPQKPEQLVAAIQAAQKRSQEKWQQENPKPMTEEQAKELLEQQRAFEVNAFQQRYNRLIQRINNPKQRNPLDLLELQALRERQLEAAKMQPKSE